ncbi:type VII secretion system-associated protein [Streptomyces sp. R1]|uniref:type VII secretion system-associated protein n=1 Tax=Streptomyces sp. R1 TaxID=1509279 RepID=UPI001E399814|nr:type VII secretion system-associated protein [Streptomyces sp. R1]MCC8338953.1 type VII secretion system-associated protein [Streptomyces sp. R1]
MANDPNSSTGPLLMDPGGLRSFIDNRVLPFKDAINKIQVDDPNAGYTLATLLGDTDITTAEQFDSYETGLPLAIGFMAGGGVMGDKGKELNEGMVKTITSLVEIYGQQAKLFDDVVDNMESTIAKLRDTQGGNLVKLDGQEFLDIFEDAVDDLRPSTGGQGGDDK